MQFGVIQHNSISYMQVCIPGLHISLGIFNRLYNLEHACHELDLLLAERSTGEVRAGNSFGLYSAALTKLSELQGCHEVTQQVLMHIAMSLPHAEENEMLKICCEWIMEHHRKAAALVCSIQT